MDQMFNLFLALQLVKVFLIYQLEMPANAVIILQQIKKIVDFEMLKPKFLLGMVFTPE